MSLDWSPAGATAIPSAHPAQHGFQVAPRTYLLSLDAILFGASRQIGAGCHEDIRRRRRQHFPYGRKYCPVGLSGEREGLWSFRARRIFQAQISHIGARC